MNLLANMHFEGGTIGALAEEGSGSMDPLRCAASGGVQCRAVIDGTLCETAPACKLV